jgi:hypothetical protein
MGLLFFREGDVIEVPLIVLDDSIQADSKVRDQHMFP